MVSSSQTLWLCVNPHLKQFDWRLCQQLNHHTDVKFWSYHQTADESCSMQVALDLLHQYVQNQNQPIDLLGHGLSGTLGLLYARRYPQIIRSVTLLSVGANPSISWHAHYYNMRKLLPTSREAILYQMANMVFGAHETIQTIKLAKLLENVLDTELALHSLAHQTDLSSGGIERPLLICNGAQDAIVDPTIHAQWRPWLKPGDRLWSCPTGRHFFHHDYPILTSQIILEFWQHIPSLTPKPLVPSLEALAKTLRFNDINNSALLPGD